ncbi:MFS transporter [Komagataeibacter europaeus]|uniref:MFS transporter n=1 Tax=Komagataeibacter europaeus TaxID=33995 RepID=UPI000B574327|nr:MFS transporter [Komagataeibacter europaeus]ARW15382.1 putative MFS-type transporter YbcL [Komagataeibacter europaeus]
MSNSSPRNHYTQQAAPGATIARYSPLLAFIMAMATFMQNLDGAIINTSLPAMARSFGVRTLDLSLGVTAYMLASAAISPVSAWLAMKYGEKRVMWVAMLLFTFSSFLCGIAQGLGAFVCARIGQGLAGAVMMPVGMSIILRHTPKSDLLKAQSVTVWPALSAPIIGPVLGGYLTQTVGWRWNFWLNLPVGLIAVFCVLRVVPAEPPEGAPRLDVRGFGLSALSLTCLLSGLQRSAETGTARFVALGLMGIGAVTGVAAIRHLRRHPTPILSLAPLKRASLRYASLYPGLIFRAVFSSAPFLLPLFFQLGFGFSPARAGTWLLAYFCANLGIKPATSAIIRWAGFRNVLFFNGFLVCASLLPFVFLTPDTPAIVLGLSLAFAGMTRSLQLTSLSTIAFADVGQDERSRAASVMSILGQTGSTAGVAITAFCLTVLERVYGHATVSLKELHIAFFMTAVFVLVGTLGFGKMPANIGREVSGHGLRR